MTSVPSTWGARCWMHVAPIVARTHARTLRSFERHHLGYGDPRGLLELRKSVCDYLRAARGVRCEVDQIVITAGTQQAVDIVARVMPGPDKEVWIEDPGYTLTRLTLTASGAKVCAIPVDQHGVNVTGRDPPRPEGARSFS